MYYRKRFYISIAFIFLLSWISVAAQPLKITSSVNRTTVSLNQQVVLNIDLEGEAAQKVKPSPPDVPDCLKFVGTGGTSQNIQFTNGQMSVKISSKFIYQAYKPGTCTIPSVSVSYQGKTFKSDPIVLKIVKGSSPGTQNKTGQQADLGEKLFLRALVNKTRVFQNEPVFVTFRIYTQLNISSYSLSKLPETSGFWSEEIEQKGQPQTREEIYKGEKFVVADIRKIALFPTSVGKKTIGSLVLDCDVRVKRSRSRDIFDSFFDDPFFSRTIRRTISSKPIQITVDPLPAENKPANFSGAVGQFKLDTKVDKTRVKANEAITFTVTISGQGNIKILPRPVLNVSSDFEEYDPKITERITRADNSIRGYKTFEYVLIPRFPGEQIIEPVHFTYFDPSDKSYKTKSSPAFTINVEKSGEENLSFGQGVSKEEVRLIGKDIRFIKLKNPNLQQIDYHIYDQTLFYVLLAIPFIALMFSLVYQQQQKKLHKNEAYARSKRANKLAMKKLSKAKKLLHKDAQKEFYAEISHALTGFAADKLNVSAASIISTELENDFRKRNLNENLRGEYISLLQTCDFYRFGTGGGHLEEMKKIYERSKNAIINLEKAL